MKLQAAQRWENEIKSFIIGKTIQSYSHRYGWYDVDEPDFSLDAEYRVKPEPPLLHLRQWEVWEVPVGAMFRKSGKYDGQKITGVLHNYHGINHAVSLSAAQYEHHLIALEAERREQ